MTLARFVTKSAFRNKRRSLLRSRASRSPCSAQHHVERLAGFYIDKGAPDSALRIMTRHKVSLANFLPIYYRDKIRAIPGVVHVVPMTWFQGTYINNKPENFFGRLATDPENTLTSPPIRSCPPTSLRPGSVIAPAV